MLLSNDVPVTIVGHSQGNAYGLGVARAIFAYQRAYNARESNTKKLDIKVNFIALAVFQGDYLAKYLPKESDFKMIQWTYGNDMYQCRPIEGGGENANFYPELKAHGENYSNFTNGGTDAHSAVINQPQALEAVFTIDHDYKIFAKKKKI